MKSITRYSLLFCLAWICMLFANCADDIIQNDTTPTGKSFELKVSQSTVPATRLELGQDGLTTRWQPNDKLVLVDKARTKAPIYLTCTLTEPAASATFASESGVPAGGYWVIYNYNENLAYGHQGFSSVDEINTNDKLVLYGELNIAEGASAASVEMKHLYAQVRIQLKNIPSGTNANYIIGMYSSKKGFSVFKQFTARGLVNAEYGIDPNSMNSHTNTYFPSDKKWHNIRFGQYNAKGTWIEGYYDDNNNYVDGYFQSSTQQLSNSALVLPENMSDEDVYFYVLSGNQCYEFKKTNKVNLKAGISYTVVLDFNDATVKTSTLNSTTDNNGMNTVYEISTPEQWRHAAYRNDNGSYKITDNIDFIGEHFFPIAANNINGNERKLSNISLDWPNEDNVGLYKREWRWETWNSITQTSDNWHMEIEQPKSNYCTISNLTLESVTFKGKSYVGAFGGYNVSADKCKVIGTSVVSGTGDYVGGIVGWNSLSSYNYGDNKTPILSDVSVGQNCTVTGANYVGGIVGRYGGTEMNPGSLNVSSSLKPFDNCISHATVTGNDYVGGIFGKIGGYNANSTSTNIEFSMDDYTFSLLKCQNKGDVTGNDYVGGIGGDFAIVCYSGNTVDRVVLKQSFSDGKVKGNNYVGGILGSSMASVNTCYSINTVEASVTGLGGIVGTVSMSYTSRIVNCYSLSALAVGANGVAGGIVGLSGDMMMGRATVVNCYFAGTNSTNCGIIGNSGGSCTVDHCLTTLPSLGTNLDTSAMARPSNPRQEWNPDTQQSETVYDYYPDFIIDSQYSVTSIQDNKVIINRDNAYSDNIWSNYPHECVKFASFSADTNSPDFDDEVIN